MRKSGRHWVKVVAYCGVWWALAAAVLAFAYIDDVMPPLYYVAAALGLVVIGTASLALARLRVFLQQEHKWRERWPPGHGVIPEDLLEAEFGRIHQQCVRRAKGAATKSFCVTPARDCRPVLVASREQPMAVIPIGSAGRAEDSAKLFCAAALVGGRWEVVDWLFWGTETQALETARKDTFVGGRRPRELSRGSGDSH